eukprot:5570865-Prymnesium_polylepis.1
MSTLTEFGSDVVADMDTPFDDWGIDSLASTELVSRLRVSSGVGSLAPTMALDYPTARSMASHILELAAAEAPIDDGA